VDHTDSYLLSSIPVSYPTVDERAAVKKNLFRLRKLVLSCIRRVKVLTAGHMYEGIYYLQ